MTIVEVDFDEAEYIGDENDGVYFDVIEHNGKWYVSADVDCNTAHFVDNLMIDEGPFNTEKEALECGRSTAIDWCIENRVEWDNADSNA